MVEVKEKKIFLEFPGVMLGFNTEEGTFDIIDTTTGLALISQATMGFNGKTLKDSRIECAKSGKGYLITALFGEGSVRIKAKLTLHPEKRIYFIDMSLTNLSQEPLILKSLSPFSLSRDEGGNLYLHRPVAFALGYHSWNESRVYDFGKDPTRSILSHWMTAIEDSSQYLALLLGFTSFSQAFSKVELDYVRGCSRLEARTIFDGIAVPPGKSIKGERFVIAVTCSGKEALHLWTDLVRTEMNVKEFPPAPSGWCSWYHAYENIDEEYILKNLDRAADLDFLDYFQIDDGYQESEGDWLCSNAQFPRGIPFIIERIKEKGLSAGLWVAPFMVSRDSSLFRKHSQWLIKDSDGKPAPLLDWRKGTMYGLDLSHPGSQKWLHNLFSVMSGEWNVDIFKLDFLYLGAAQGTRHNRAWTGAQCYRKGLEIIREALGGKFILASGAPLGPSIGLVDAMRISGDVSASWRGELSACTSISNTLSMYFTNRRLWINDPDCVVIRDVDTALNIEEIQTLLTVVGFSGGVAANGDDLARLSAGRLALFRMIVPPLRESAAPSNLFTAMPPTILDRRIERSFGVWHILALINLKDYPADLSFDLSSLEMRKKDYLLYDFWEDRFLGIYRKEVLFRAVPPHATKLLCVRVLHRFPQLISTNLHISQGGAEVKGCSWSTPSKTLTLSVHSPGTRECKLIFYVPSGFEVDRVESGGADFSERMRGDGLFEVSCTFTREFETKIWFRSNPGTGVY